MNNKLRKFLETFRKKYLIFIIFFIVLQLRLLFAFQTSEFSDDFSYYALRQVEHIKAKGVPFFEDDKSFFTQSTSIYPVFYYLIALFSYLMPVIWAAKIIPNISASLIVFVVYALSYKLTRDRTASLFAAFLSGFLPVFFIDTVNSISVFSVIIPLLLFSFYCFLMIPSNEKYVYHFVIAVSLFSFTHPSVFILLFGLLVYFIIMKSESIETKSVEIEVIIVSLFIILWSQFLVYKNAFLIHGLNVISQNVPEQIMSLHFPETDIFSAIYMMGIIPVFFAVHTLFQYMQEKKSRYMFFFLSYTLPVFFMLWFNVIRLRIGLIFLSAAFVVISGRYFHDFMVYISKSKFAYLKGIFISVMIVIVALTMFIPAIDGSVESLENRPSDELIDGLLLLKDYSDPESVILSPLEISHIVQYYSNRTTFIDRDFLLISDINQKYEDYVTMYDTIYETEALEMLNKYSIDYIIFTPEITETLDSEELAYVGDESCFMEIYSKDDIKIYQVLCTLEEIR
ncbi:MAG: hypothetical protein ACLFPQ_00995 [Candidatus Woesearchaeota archaeon]